ncbi:MAG: flavin reductase family protein [Prevotella sp.]|nr:flavin reductase family protein [Prevotella sp.]
MTIGCGTVGIIWERPIFVAYVRHQRYTREMLDECREFTINVPVGEYRKKILGICGSKSGRDMDKIEAAGLTLVAPEVINTPGIKELPLTLECRVLYSQEQQSGLFNDEITRQFYTMETGDHICYYGEIISACRLPPSQKVRIAPTHKERMALQAVPSSTDCRAIDPFGCCSNAWVEVPLAILQ